MILVLESVGRALLAPRASLPKRQYSLEAELIISYFGALFEKYHPYVPVYGREFVVGAIIRPLT